MRRQSSRSLKCNFCYDHVCSKNIYKIYDFYALFAAFHDMWLDEPVLAAKLRLRNSMRTSKGEVQDGILSTFRR